MTDDFVTSEMISRDLVAVERDIRRLRDKLRRLEAERDVLRNAAAAVRSFVEEKRKQGGGPAAMKATAGDRRSNQRFFRQEGHTAKLMRYLYCTNEGCAVWQTAEGTGVPYGRAQAVLSRLWKSEMLHRAGQQYSLTIKGMMAWEESPLYKGSRLGDGEPSSFLDLAAARSLSLEEVLQMSEEEASWIFQGIRWHVHGGQPHCPRCNCDDLYVCRAEDRWKCKDCGYRFSVTSGTIFGSRKMAIRDILAAIAIVANGEKRISALRLSRQLGVTYKTALDLAHRIRGSTPRATGRRAAKARARRLGLVGSGRT